MSRLYADENFAFQTVESLRLRGHDVLTAHEAGKANQAIPDEDVLIFAHTIERAILTFNRKHFIRLHLQEYEHSGIIVCTIDPDFSALADRIQETLQASVTLDNHLIRINRPSG